MIDPHEKVASVHQDRCIELAERILDNVEAVILLKQQKPEEIECSIRAFCEAKNALISAKCFDAECEAYREKCGAGKGHCSHED